MPRKAALWASAALLLLTAAPAKAQFANWGLGLAVGYDFIWKENILLGVPIGLRGSYYVDQGFELTAAVNFQYLRSSVANKDAYGILPQVGFRYLFLQETIRPYVGADLDYWHIFANPAAGGVDLFKGVDLVGIGPKAGCEFFTSDSFSLGVEANAGFFFALNQPVDVRLSLIATANVYF
jgi:outer membrane protein